jgi:hypothetical protein
MLYKIVLFAAHYNILCEIPPHWYLQDNEREDLLEEAALFGAPRTLK